MKRSEAPGRIPDSPGAFLLDRKPYHMYNTVVLYYMSNYGFDSERIAVAPMISFEGFAIESGSPIYLQIIRYGKRGIAAGSIRTGRTALPAGAVRPLRG
jgi:hypothetical protein